MSMIKYRVHEVAKDFNVTSKVISQILTDYIAPPKNHMQVLENHELKYRCRSGYIPCRRTSVNCCTAVNGSWSFSSIQLFEKIVWKERKCRIISDI